MINSAAVRGMNLHEYDNTDRVLMREIKTTYESAGQIVVLGTSPSGAFPVEARFNQGDPVLDGYGVACKNEPLSYEMANILTEVD